jgi:putative restriction endonuclease
VTADPLESLLRLRQHQHEGVRSPHKPLLVLLALGRLACTGSSQISWAEARTELAELITAFGPPSKTAAAQKAAYPFTRLRSDMLWVIDADVPMDRVTPLAEQHVTGQFPEVVERALRDPQVLRATARSVVEAEFPSTLIPDVLTAAGLDPDEVYGTSAVVATRRRSSAWPAQILSAWDRQCAFCGFDGQLGSSSVGLEAAHIRWFNYGGPDDLDNGLTLCSLHHKLLDRGVLGVTESYQVQVSTDFSARTEAGRQVYELADRELRPRPGTPLPNPSHVHWHQTQVFKGLRLTA